MRAGASTSATASPGAPPFAPRDWPEVLRLIKRMRAAGGAPVDTMGCEKISEDAALDAKGRRFVTLVSAMLSSQTKRPDHARRDRAAGGVRVHAGEHRGDVRGGAGRAHHAGGVPPAQSGYLKAGGGRS